MMSVAPSLARVYVRRPELAEQPLAVTVSLDSDDLVPEPFLLAFRELVTSLQHCELSWEVRPAIPA